MPEWVSVATAVATILAAILAVVPVLTSLGLLRPIRDRVGTAEAKIRAVAEIDRAKDLIGQGPGAEYFRPQFIADHLEVSRLRRALRHLQVAAQLDPTNPDAHRLSGIAYRRLNEYDAMFAEYEVAERLDPGNCANVLGNLLDELGEWSKADAAFSAFLRKRGSDAVAHANQARVLLKLNRLKEAADAARAAIEAGPTYPGGYNELAAVMLRSGRQSDAVDLLERSIQKAPRYEARAFVDLAGVLMARGDTDKAAEYLRQALHNEPNSIAAHEERRRLLIMRGETEDASREERIVKRLRAEDEQRIALLRKAMAKTGRNWVMNSERWDAHGAA